VLLLLDNALNAQQVERLTPPAGCLMILTGREHFTLPGIFAEDLPVLDPEEARELLLKIAPNVGEYAIKLAKLCGYLPEALRTAASALASAPNLDPVEFLYRMNSARRRLALTGVELSLATSSELLSEQLRDRWLQLGVFPGTFDQFAAAAVWQTSNRDAKNTLASLLRYSLVEFDSRRDRYYVHDLVRDFTLSRLDESAFRSARFRHSKYYAEILAAADYLYRQSDTGVSLGLEMFDAERLNIEAGQRWPAANASGGEGLARLCLRYSEAGINLLPLRLNISEQIAWLTAGADSVRFLSKPRPGRNAVFRSEVRVLNSLANAHLSLGELPKAAELFQRSVDRLEDLHAIYEGIDEAIGFGDLLRASGKYKKALKLHQGARLWIEVVKTFPLFIYWNKSPEDLLKAECHLWGSFGDDYLAIRDCDRALESFRSQLRFAEHIGDRRIQLRALGGLGAAYKLVRNYEFAIDFQTRSLAIAEELQDKEGEAAALFNMALVAAATKDRIAAIEHGRAALAIYELIKSPSAEDVRCAIEKWRGNLIPRSNKRSRSRTPIRIPRAISNPGLIVFAR
jgi:tetratricopeptide (TPR) repeat protein